MTRRRGRRFAAAFKTRVVLEALREEEADNSHTRG